VDFNLITKSVLLILYEARIKRVSSHILKRDLW